MVVVAAHNPCGGGGGHGRFLFGVAQHRRGCLIGCPILQVVQLQNLSSCFAFRITASWGAQSHNTVASNHFAFRITAAWGAQSHDAVVLSRFVFHGCPIPEFQLCQQQVHCLSHYGCVLLCVSRQFAEPLDACTSHPPKNSRGDRPIYHFHFNIHFLKAPLALCWSQAPRHSRGNTTSPQQFVLRGCQSAAGSNKAQ